LWFAADSSPLAVSINFLQLNLDDPIKKDTKHRYLPKSIVVYARLSQQVCLPLFVPGRGTMWSNMLYSIQDHGRDTVSLDPSFITSVYGPQRISTELEEQLELDLLDEGIAADDHQYYVHIAPTNLIECDEVILGALDKNSYDFIVQSKCNI
jgi:hypothetical protein